MKEFENIIEFIKFTHVFQKVERMIYVSGTDRNENDLEHSYQLALVAWYLVSLKELSLNTELIIKYAIVHDLVEAYAGDTYFLESESDRTSKDEAEHKAFLRIRKEFSEFGEMLTLIEEYEKKQDEESKFVYALDKVLPVLNIYMDQGRTWHREGLSLGVLASAKRDKVKVSKVISELWKELEKRMKANENELFPS